jgi:hypothetical protein
MEGVGGKTPIPSCLGYNLEVSIIGINNITVPYQPIARNA